MIPFSLPLVAGSELGYLREAVQRGQFSGDGGFTERCQAWLEQHLRCGKALLTTSGTAALEMAALLAKIEPGDEVIMPSFTFVSTANAVVLRGAVPVFVDIRPDTLNLDETLVEAAITLRTKAISVVHYAGIAANMPALTTLACRHGLTLIEDAAQALLAGCDGRPLGAWGGLAALSFHATKNAHCGEGGALLINDPALLERAEVLWQKGTNRALFDRGLIAKYEWVDVGSSFLPSELTAAFLLAQLEAVEDATARRIARWQRYHQALADDETRGLLHRPGHPPGCTHNGHLYFILLPDAARRAGVIAALRDCGVEASFHYVPLHSAPAGRRFGRVHGSLAVTESAAARIVRLPLWADISADQQETVIAAVKAVLRHPAA